MVYDIGANDDLWFGGCADAGCTGNQTWVFANGTWTNDTGNLSAAPPPRSDAMMEFLEYMPHADSNGVPLLFGGEEPGPNGTVLLGNDTWLFQGGAWTNVTQPCPCVPALSHGSLAFDPVLNVSLLFGGCVGSANCAVASGASWSFDAKTSAWGPLNVSGPSARYGAAMAYDPALQAIVLFGGAGACGSGSCPHSDTWTYTTLGWTNVTGSFGGPTPPPRVGGALIWDAALHEMVLAGGASTAGGPRVNSTYALTCASPGAACNWTGPLAATGTGLTGSAAAANATGLDPMLVGGATTSGAPSNATWVYSALPDLNVGVTPSRPEVSQLVTLNATAVGSTDPTFAIHWGDGTTETTLTGLAHHVYAAAGTYDVEVAVTDPNGSANLHELGVLVVPAPAGAIVVEYPGVDVGTPDAFTAVPTLATGTPPFNFTWNFGTPPLEYGSSVTWTFATPGVQTVNVAMVDSDGLRGSNVTTIVVAAPLSVTVEPQVSPAGTTGTAEAERGVPVPLVAEVENGTAPFNFTWNFGDGTFGWGIGTSHAFGTTADHSTVHLTVVDSGGGSAATTVDVRLVPALSVPRLSETPASPQTGSPVQFDLDVSGGAGPDAFDWSFGDGTADGTVQNASHTYDSPGTYVANVTVTDGLGGVAQQQITVQVASSPTLSVERALSSPWTILGLALLAAGAGVVVWKYRAGRTRPPEEPAENDP
jgi:PKD repeat protein